jgi:hypothetical protein
VIVHILKLERLYLILYGEKIKKSDFIKTYCKVTPVSVIFPYKIGEFFRMYCYGMLIDNVLKGIIIILLDRLMDTMALITVIILVWIFNGGSMVSFVYLLLIFLLFMFIVYSAFPKVYKFWKRYFLREKASEYNLKVLKFLERLNTVYCEVESVAKGRGTILYCISLIVWGVEIGSLCLLNGIDRHGYINDIISDYLISAMRGNQSIELKRFVISSVAVLIVVYLIIKASKMTARKKDS